MLLKAFAAPGALLPGVLSKIVEVFFFYLFVDQGAVGGLSCGGCGGKQRVLLVRGDERRGLPQCVMVVARPGVVGGITGHVSSDGIEFDVAVAGEQIAVGIDQCSLEASFPQRAGAPIACMKLPT